MLRRETIIALRARHEAFRIALEILYPQQKPPEAPVVPVEPSGMATSKLRVDREWIEREVRKSERRHARRMKAYVWFVRVLQLNVLVWSVLAAVLFVRTQLMPRSSPPLPPPPQARPILPAQ